MKYMSGKMAQGTGKRLERPGVIGWPKRDGCDQERINTIEIEGMGAETKKCGPNRKRSGWGGPGMLEYN